jgi:nucleoside 2-deoxyribosyltransferase
MQRNPQTSTTHNVFVAGPIVNAISDGEYDALLRMLITSVLSVLEHGDYTVFSAHRVEDFGLHPDKFCSHEVVMRDFEWISRCDTFVAILPAGRDGVLRTDGTHVELGWASALGKRIMAVAPLPVPKNYGHMLRGLAVFERVDFIDIREVQDRPQILLEELERKRWNHSG